MSPVAFDIFFALQNVSGYVAPQTWNHVFLQGSLKGRVCVCVCARLKDFTYLFESQGGGGGSKTWVGGGHRAKQAPC